MPEPPESLMPVRLDTGERRSPAILSGPDSARPAAVLVLIAPAIDVNRDGEADVLLIRRVDRGGHHGGQIAFPGGRAEPDDADSIQTALREAAEEVALDPVACGIRLVGTLETFWIPVSDYRVTPVLAIAERRPDVTASEAEVAEILWVPVSAFLPGAPIEIVEADVLDFRIRYGAYALPGAQVWGATARILGQLGAILASARAAGRPGQPST
ncbi:MAG TPA: CoA pyrophosphatase [Candidatus Sulfomarinibacteraceae bacterium]|nr:CoA pyrophosphatase [Candidatus Sulfomarinibacteraceae bacterium]